MLGRGVTSYLKLCGQVVMRRAAAACGTFYSAKKCVGKFFVSFDKEIKFPSVHRGVFCQFPVGLCTTNF